MIAGSVATVVVDHSRLSRTAFERGTGWALERQAPVAGPRRGHEDDWPYESDWLTEMSELGPHDYYPPMT